MCVSCNLFAVNVRNIVIMSFTEGHVLTVSFDTMRRYHLTDLDDKYGSFFVLVYTNEGDGATASYAISKNRTSYQLATCTAVPGTEDDYIDMFIEDGSVFVELIGDTLSAKEYHIKVIG